MCMSCGTLKLYSYSLSCLLVGVWSVFYTVGYLLVVRESRV